MLTGLYVFFQEVEKTDYRRVFVSLFFHARDNHAIIREVKSDLAANIHAQCLADRFGKRNLFFDVMVATSRIAGMISLLALEDL